MAVFRLQHNVPEIYVNESRDFQLLCRAYDCINGAVKFDIDTIADVTDTNICNSRLLPLLQTKIGFFSDEDLDNDALRYVLKAFPYMVKNKGSRKGIEQAIYTFLKIHSIDTDVLVNITNEDDVDPYSIKIGINSSFKDTTILQEMLKYIIPTGYVVEVFFYTPVEVKMIVAPKTLGRIKWVSANVISQVRSQDYITYTNPNSSSYTYSYTKWDENKDDIGVLFGEWVDDNSDNSYDSTSNTNHMSMRTFGAIDTSSIVSYVDIFDVNDNPVEYSDYEYNTETKWTAPPPPPKTENEETENE